MELWSQSLQNSHCQGKGQASNVKTAANLQIYLQSTFKNKIHIHSAKLHHLQQLWFLSKTAQSSLIPQVTELAVQCFDWIVVTAFYEEDSWECTVFARSKTKKVSPPFNSYSYCLCLNDWWQPSKIQPHSAQCFWILRANEKCELLLVTPHIFTS